MNKDNAKLLCKAADVPPGAVKQVEVVGFDDSLAVYNLNGTYFLTEDTCTHAMASLSNGDIEDGLIYCPLHGGAFNIKTGEAVEEPCTTPLKIFKIFQEGDDLYGILLD